MIQEVSKIDVVKDCEQCVNKIGQNLKSFREEKGLTQSDVAFYIFSDKSLISALERGVHKNITLNILIRLSKLFKKEIEEFLK